MHSRNVTPLQHSPDHRGLRGRVLHDDPDQRGYVLQGVTEGHQVRLLRVLAIGSGDEIKHALALLVGSF